MTDRHTVRGREGLEL